MIRGSVLPLCFGLCLLGRGVFAQEDGAKAPPGRDAFSFYLENDSRNIGGPGSDQSYSSGLKFSYLYAEEKTPVWAMPLLKAVDVIEEERQHSKSNFGFSLGQQLYTPSETGTRDFIPGDRPYAAWLYLAFSAHFKTPSHGHYWELNAGVVGPEAQGEPVQNEFHRLIDSPQVLGWEHQLKTEPTILLSYQQRMKFLESFYHESRFFEVIPFFGASAGNVLVGTHVGGMLRLGYRLPDDLGPTRPSPTGGDIFISPEAPAGKRDWFFYAFAAARGHAIAHSLFLDGNTFWDSHHVTKYPFVGETEFGFAGEIGDWSAIWRFVTRSPEFEEKSRFNSFASLTISVTL